jgi:hypothetical protein
MSDSQSSSAVRAIAQNFSLTGWIIFWIELVLGVISGVVVILFSFLSQRPGSQNNSPGTGFGLFLAICGLVALGVGIYFAFRYTRFGRQLQSSNPSNRPRKSDTVQILRLGLIVHLVGSLLSILGSQAIIGTLATKALSQAQFLFTAQGTQPFITGLDMFVVQANINVISAHFAGLAGSIWLLNKITK